MSTAAAAVDVVKRFGGVTALRGASIHLRPGEVHGLIGQNGSGKSTLLGLLSGQLQPDSGVITIGPDVVRMASPRQAVGHGVAMVSQEIALAPDLTVAENIFLGNAKPRRRWCVDWRAMHAESTRVLTELGVTVDPRTPVADIGLDLQQLVEVARALRFDARVLILDEPTSALPDQAVERLFAVVRRLRANGTAVVFVSHRLDELLSISDRVTVLRDGVTISSRLTADYSIDQLTTDMLGHEAELSAPAADRAGRSPVVLATSGVRVPGCVETGELQLRGGESVGLVGLAGAGHTDLMQAFFGLRPKAVGDLGVGDRRSLPRSPIDAIGRGVAYVAADRKIDGLVLDMTVAENLEMATQARRSQAALARRRATTDAVRALCTGVGVDPRRSDTPVRLLSGGNQQKVLIGKWLATEPRVLMLDEPTRGVDVGAKAEIYRLILDRRKAGMALLISSSDIGELLQLCDRFIVFARGRVVAERSRVDADLRSLSQLASGLAS